MADATLAHVLSGPFTLRRWPPMAAGAGTWLVYSSGNGTAKAIAPGEHMPLRDALRAAGRYFTVARRGKTQVVEFRALQGNIMAEFKIMLSFQIVVTDPKKLFANYQSDEVLSDEAQRLVTGRCRTLAFDHWTRSTGELLRELRALTAAKVRPGGQHLPDVTLPDLDDDDAGDDHDETRGGGWEVFITDVDVHPSPRRFHD